MVEKKSLAAIFTSFMLFSVLFSLLSVSAVAAQPQETLVKQYTETYPDGSYAVVSVYQNEPLTRSGPISGHNDYNYYDGGLAWTFTVNGTFTYTGSSAVCQAASCTYSIHNNVWYCVSSSANPSGNAAVASGTMCRGTDGRRVYPSVTLYCSPNGSLS